MKYKQILILLIIANCLFQTCKFPKDEIETFDVNTDASFVNILMKLKFSTEDSLPIKKISLTITGKDAKEIFDIEGKTNYNAEGGVLDLILGPNANPTDKNPSAFTVQAQMEGYLPIKQEVFVFNKTQKFTTNFQFKRPVSLPVGLNYKSSSVAFLGKRVLDTVAFSITRTDGISFNIIYPTKGLVFLRKTLVKFKTEITPASVKSLYLDTTLFQTDSGNNSVPRLSDKVYKYNKNTNQNDVLYNKLTLVSRALSKNTRVGYRKPEIQAQYQDRIIPDTVAISNVRVNIVSASNFLEYGYYNENGVFENEFNIFNDAIGIPQIFFYDAYSGNQLIPYYTNGQNGVIIEANLPVNNYKMFIEGIDYSNSLNTFFETKQTVEVKPEFFEPVGSEYKLVFRDDFLNGRFFLYNTNNKSCGFASVKLNTENVPVNVGFKGNISIKNSLYNVTKDLDFTTSFTEFRVPAFASENTVINAFIDHPVNICRSNPPLYSQDVLTALLCNYTNSVLNINLTYNPTSFLSTINSNSPLEAKAFILCPSGNFILPPAIDLNIWQLGCNAENSLKFENGRFVSTSLIEKYKTYVVRYDKLSISGAPTKIYDTLTFNPDSASIEIEDKKTGYWKGTLKYTASEGFKLEVIFDNRKFRYNIPNCK